MRVQLLDSSEILESFYKEARKLGDLQKLGATLQVLSNTTMGLQSLDQHCLTIMGNVEMCAQLAGLFTTYVILNLTDGNGQPALLYIVPFTLGMFSSNGFRRRIHVLELFRRESMFWSFLGENPCFGAFQEKNPCFGAFFMLIEDANFHHFDVQVSWCS